MGDVPRLERLVLGGRCGFPARFHDGLMSKTNGYRRLPPPDERVWPKVSA